MTLLSLFLFKNFDAMQHVLSLDIPDTLNKCILRIVDTSVYLTNPPPTCPQLEVTVPGFSTATVLGEVDGINPGFMANLTACSLGLQSTNCGTTYADLPDGIYILRWSISPNEHAYVEYNHLRITTALNRIEQALCDLELGPCDPPTDKMDKLNQITLIKNFLDAAKAMVEYCHYPDKGMDLYRYAIKLLDKLTCSTGCSTTSSSSSCSSC